MIDTRDERAGGPFRFVYRATDTVSIGASGSGTVTLTVPDGRRVFIKTITVTKGANVTVTANEIDGQETSQTDTFDSETVFGIMLNAEDTISMSGDNAGAGSEDLTILVEGYSVQV